MFYFADLFGALLLAVTVALVIGMHNAERLTLPHDTVFQMPLQALYGILAGLSFSVALVCLFSKNSKLKAALVLWMTLNVVLYAMGLQWNNSNAALSSYLSSVADAFGLTPAAAFWLAKIICLYLLLGSCAVLMFGKWFSSPPGKDDLVKMACPACGVHLRFDGRNLGQKIPCPHCQKTITLRKPDLLKMACFFCQEHIEFPAHAIGEKMPCPHCNMDITLKEPA